MSTSVACAFDYFGDPETKETEVFVRMFDRFFDCLNVRSPTEWYQKKKESLKPYTSPDDDRLQVYAKFTCLIVKLCMYTCMLIGNVWNLDIVISLLCQWLEHDFLGYLDEWESDAKSSSLAASEKRRMTLSEATLQGLRITGMYTLST